MNDYIIQKKNQDNFRQIIKFGIFGISKNTIGYLVYLTITYSGLNPEAAVSILYSFGMIVGFFGIKRWVFLHSGKLFQTGLRYLIVYLFGFIINLSLLIIFVQKLGYPHQIIQFIAIFIVGVFLFTMMKFFVFISL